MRKKCYWYGLAFLIPLLLSIAICAGNGVYPFGEQCILHVDMYHQYCPFFTEFLNKLQNGGSLMYTWREGLGSDFVALYAYYLASPLNWLLILWPKAYVIEFMTLTILIKIGVAGLCMFLFLDAHFALEQKGRVLLWTALVFSFAYALSGFVAAYSWDIMWMDGVALAPLIYAGLERLVKEGRAALYYISLSVAILANYYIGMIICVFLVFYFLFLFLEQRAQRGRAFLQFVWYSLLAGALVLISFLSGIGGAMSVMLVQGNSMFNLVMSQIFSLSYILKLNLILRDYIHLHILQSIHLCLKNYHVLHIHINHDY